VIDRSLQTVAWCVLCDTVSTRAGHRTPRRVPRRCASALVVRWHSGVVVSFWPCCLRETTVTTLRASRPPSVKPGSCQIDVEVRTGSSKFKFKKAKKKKKSDHRGFGTRARTLHMSLLLHASLSPRCSPHMAMGSRWLSHRLRTDGQNLFSRSLDSQSVKRMM
jgi:hypothetical protein